LAGGVVSALDDSTELRRAAERRVAAKHGFLIHALVFVVVNVGLLGINLTTSPNYPWAAWRAFGWGIGLAAHGLAVSRKRDPAGNGTDAPRRLAHSPGEMNRM